MALLLQITFLTIFLRYVPCFFLRALPKVYKRCCRRVNEIGSQETWQPNCYKVDYKLDEYNSLEDGPKDEYNISGNNSKSFNRSIPKNESLSMEERETFDGVYSILCRVSLQLSSFIRPRKLPQHRNR